MTALSTAALKDSFYFMEILMGLLICRTKTKAWECLRALLDQEPRSLQVCAQFVDQAVRAYKKSRIFSILQKECLYFSQVKKFKCLLQQLLISFQKQFFQQGVLGIWFLPYFSFPHPYLKAFEQQIHSAGCCHSSTHRTFGSSFCGEAGFLEHIVCHQFEYSNRQS